MGPNLAPHGPPTVRNLFGFNFPACSQLSLFIADYSRQWKTSLHQCCVHSVCPYLDTISDFTFLYINFPISVVLPTLAAHSWFFDDANAVGTLAELSQVVDIVRREGPALGILLNNDKSSIWSPLVLGPGEKDPLKRGIKRVEDSGIKLLGAPIALCGYPSLSRDFKSF